VKCALYMRVSTTDQQCEVQARELRDYCQRRGWDIAEEYRDEGVSGAKKSRPGLDRLMKSAQSRHIDTIIVWKLDRFSRSVLHLNEQLAVLKSCGVRFLAVSQNIDTDSSNPTSGLLLNILAAVAEFERELIRERTKSGVELARARGKVFGRPRKVFRRDEAVAMRNAGVSFRVIAKTLGVATTTVVNELQGRGTGRRGMIKT
jgi:putative DNA-invertase from lambdoid prophage Rac